MVMNGYSPNEPRTWLAIGSKAIPATATTVPMPKAAEASVREATSAKGTYRSPRAKTPSPATIPATIVTNPGPVAIR